MGARVFLLAVVGLATACSGDKGERDGNGGTANSTVAVTITAVNDNPVANADSQTTNEDTAASIAVLTNDTDVEGDTLTVTAASASNGAVVIETDNSLTYTLSADFNGSDTINYTIADGNGGTANSTVAVTITAVKSDVTMPIASVTAKPLIGPDPKTYRNIEANKVVKFESTMVESAR